MEEGNTGFVELINEWPVEDESGPGPVMPAVSVPTAASFILRNIHRPKRTQEQALQKPVAVKAPCEEEREPLAAAALSKWWRKRGKVEVGDSISLPDSTNPNTLLSVIARSEEGQKFMISEVKRLRQKVTKSTGDVSAALSSFYERLGNLSLAKLHIETAIEKEPDEAEYRLLEVKIQRQLDIRRVQEDALIKLNINSKTTNKLTMPACQQVPRLAGDKLSYREFFFKYALTHTPVVITGVVDNMTAEPWTFQHIRDQAGSCRAMVKRSVQESAEWARLEDCKEIKVSGFMDNLEGSSKASEQLYLFDWSLPINCPVLAEELFIPKYFAADFLQRTSPGSLYQNSWPSLFMAPAGMTSELHVDTFGSNFWMALFQGRKRWLFFPSSDVPLLYPRYEHTMDPVFDADFAQPDLHEQPLVSLTQPVECILEPGDLLFVPAGCPHRVENLEKSLAISGNFVDLSNLDLVKKELQISGLTDPRADDLLHQFERSDFMCNMCDRAEHVPWKQYKAWPPEDYGTYSITSDSLHGKADVADGKINQT